MRDERYVVFVWLLKTGVFVDGNHDWLSTLYRLLNFIKYQINQVLLMILVSGCLYTDVTIDFFCWRHLN